MTYCLNKKSPISSKEPRLLQLLGKMLPCVTLPVVLKWSTTQVRVCGHAWARPSSSRRCHPRAGILIPVGETGLRANRCKEQLLFSHSSLICLSGTLWTAARQAPLSIGFSRQGFWSVWPFPPPGDLPDPESLPER